METQLKIQKHFRLWDKKKKIVVMPAQDKADSQAVKRVNQNEETVRSNRGHK